MTCCPVGKHPHVADIDRAIRAQQAASLAGESTRAPSYSQIARTYGVRKATLLDHRDKCLAQRTGTADGGVPVRSDGVPGRTADGASDQNANDSAAVDRYAESVPAAGTDDARVSDGRATGPPGDGTDRRNMSRTGVPTVAQSGAAVAHVVPGDRDANVVVESSSAGASSPPSVVGQSRPAERSPPSPDDLRRARAREYGKKGWDKLAHDSVQQAVRNLANATHDIAIRDPSVRAHASYVEEIAEIVQSGEWEDERTVQRLTRAWEKSRLFVLQTHRDACTLIRVARGTRFEQVESSAARWMRIFNTAMGSEAPEAQRVAAEALKGYDRVLGLVDAGTKVQVNVMQNSDAQAFLTDVWETLRAFPDAAAALRARLASKRDAYGELPPVEVVDAAE